eukprot:3539011-Pleurochrysis_carterae.AAC.1
MWPTHLIAALLCRQLSCNQLQLLLHSPVFVLVCTKCTNSWALYPHMQSKGDSLAPQAQICLIPGERVYKVHCASFIITEANAGCLQMLDSTII